MATTRQLRESRDAVIVGLLTAVEDLQKRVERLEARRPVKATAKTDEK